VRTFTMAAFPRRCAVGWDAANEPRPKLRQVPFSPHAPEQISFGRGPEVFATMGEDTLTGCLFRPPGTNAGPLQDSVGAANVSALLCCPVCHGGATSATQPSRLHSARLDFRPVAGKFPLAMVLVENQDRHSKILEAEGWVSG
jgi:hypothetical protein